MPRIADIFTLPVMPFLQAGGWDVWVAVVQGVPALLGVCAVTVLVLLLFPELKRRIGNADIEVEILGNKVKLSDASKNLSAAIGDLQNQVGQLIAERDQRLAVPPMGLPEAELPAEPELRAKPESGEPLEAAKGAGPGGPALSSPPANIVAWIDPNPAIHTIEIRQLQKGGWIVSIYHAVEQVVDHWPFTVPPRAVVINSASAQPSGLAALASMFPDAWFYIYGPDFGRDRMVGLSGPQSAMLTSSAVSLLSSLTETHCKQCGTLIPEPIAIEPSERRPCPVCGSMNRAFSRTLSATVQPTGNVDQ